jgi:hypothetical protein
MLLCVAHTGLYFGATVTYAILIASYYLFYKK